MRVSTVWSMVREGDTRARLRTLRDGQAALRLAIGAAARRTGVVGELANGPATTADLAARLAVEHDELLAPFLRVLVSAGHVRRRGDRWELTGRTRRALRDDAVDAMYQAFDGYHTALYRDLPNQLAGGPPRRDVRDEGALIARLSATFAPFVDALLTEHVQARRPRTVLDIGCGAGGQLVTMLTAAPAARGIGVEIDVGAANLARHAVTAAGLDDRATVFTGGLAEVLADHLAEILGTDFALLANVLYYVPVDERVAFLGHIRSALSDGGTLLLTTTAATPAMFSRHFDLLLRAQDVGMELPELSTLDRQLREAGFVPAEPHRVAPGEPLYAVVATATSGADR
jgi:SAM-dependent methyltransferase